MYYPVLSDWPSVHSNIKYWLKVSVVLELRSFGKHSMMKVYMLPTVILGLAVVAPASTVMITCYLCQDTSEECVNDVTRLTATQRIACNTTSFECVVFAQYLAGTDTINSFSRSCIPKGTYQNRCVKDANFNTCYSVCATNLCNTDSGLNTKYRNRATGAATTNHQAYLGSSVAALTLVVLFLY